MSITDATQKIKVGFVLDGDWVYTLDFVVRKVFYEEFPSQQQIHRHGVSVFVFKGTDRDAGSSNTPKRLRKVLPWTRESPQYDTVHTSVVCGRLCRQIRVSQPQNSRPSSFVQLLRGAALTVPSAPECTQTAAGAGLTLRAGAVQWSGRAAGEKQGSLPLEPFADRQVPFISPPGSRAEQGRAGWGNGRPVPRPLPSPTARRARAAAGGGQLRVGRARRTRGLGRGTGCTRRVGPQVRAASRAGLRGPAEVSWPGNVQSCAAIPVLEEMQEIEADCAVAFAEAQRWVEEVTEKNFEAKDFRASLENGVLLYKGETMWYLSLTTWLILLSIMLSSSIHAVAEEAGGTEMTIERCMRSENCLCYEFGPMIFNLFHLMEHQKIY
ncbi:uncharacterized protein [Desmodus rotundus]|uniref:uncharacterized protein n=1 Tax=Desmodus rotundus TaxID=9430 RepID=UPI002380EDFD|nr:uncharacterized protein LOC123480510 [Desmodus rotundus]